MKRLRKLSDVDIQNLELEYLKMINDSDKEYCNDGCHDYHLSSNDDSDNAENKTFLIKPTTLLVDYENGQDDTMPRPGPSEWWSSSDRWIGR